MSMKLPLQGAILIAVCLTAKAVCAGDRVAGQQTINTGHFEVPAPISQVFPLFDPINEVKWAPDFKVTPIYPLPFAVAQDSVFTTLHGGARTTWVINLYDPLSYRIEYLLFAPGYQVRRISIECAAVGADRTAVTVTYRVTGVSKDGNRHAADYDREFIAQWGPAITALFAAQTHDAVRDN
jgi:hypothetical protein